MAASLKSSAKNTSARLAVACGVIGPLFFIVAFLIEGATRSGYSPLRQPVSSLSIGDLGWTQRANFFITGALLVAFALGLGRALRPSGRAFWGPFLIGLAGLGLIGAGFFIADPLNGYPAGTPLVPVVRSLHGRLHDLFGVPVFLGLPAACFVFAFRFARRRTWGWAIYSLLAGLGMLVAFVLAGMGFAQAPGFVEAAGVWQRLSIAAGFTWIALLAFHFLRQGPPAER